MSRKSRKISFALLGVIFLCLCGLLALLVTPLPEWLANRAVDLFVEEPLGASIQIGDIEGDLFHGLSLGEVEVRFGQGQPWVRVRGILLRYDWRNLARGRWRLQEAEFLNPVLFWPLPEGTTPTAGAPAPSVTPQIMPAIPAFGVDRLTVTGGRMEGPSGVLVDSLSLQMSAQGREGQLEVQIARCHFLWPQRGLALEALSANLTFSPGMVEVAELRTETRESRLGLSGRVLLSPAFSCSLEVWADSLSLNELALATEQSLRGDLVLTAQVQGQGGIWQGNVQLGGQAQGYLIQELKGHFHWGEDKLRLEDLSLRSPGVAVRGRGYLGADPGDPGFGADLVLHQVDLSAIAQGAPSTRLTGRLLASGNGLSGETLQATADLDLSAGSVADRAFQGIRGQIRFDRGLWSVDRGLELDLEGAHLFLAGSLDAQQNLDAWAEVEVVDVGRLLDRLDLSGSLQARFRVLGPASDPALVGQLRLRDLRQGSQRLQRVRGHFGLSGVVSRQEGFFSLRFFHGNIGSLVADEGLVRGRFDGKKVFVDSLTLQSPGAQLSAAAQVSFVKGGYEILVDPLQGNYRGYSVSNESPLKLSCEDGLIRLEESKLLLEAGSIQVQGALGPDSLIQGVVHLQNVELEPISHLLPTGHLFSGLISMEASLGGSAEAPIGRASLRWEGGSFDQVTFDKINVQMAYADGRLAVEEFQARRGDNVFRGQGYLPMDILRGRLLTDDAWDLAISGEGKSPGLLSLMVREIEDMQGPFALRFRATGTPKYPRYEGFFNLRDGTLRLTSMGNSIQNLKIQTHLDGPYLVIDRIEGETPIRERNLFKRLWAKLLGKKRRGRFGVFGRIDLTGPAFDLAMEAEGLFVDYPEEMVEAELDAHLRLRGQKAPQISGQIDLIRCVISRPFTSTSQVAAVSEPPAYGLDLTVQIPKNCWVRNEVANIELRGKLRVLQQEGQLGLLGNLETVRGTYFFYGNSFRIREGRVTFDELTEINPQLDVKAWTQVDQEQIDLLIGGRLRSPTLALKSSSGYGEGDIIKMLTLHGPPVSQAVDIFSAYLQKEINRKAGQTLGVDKFTIEPGSSGELALEGAEITVGTYLSSRLYVEYSRQLSQESGEQVGVEYSLSRNLSLQGNRGEKGLYRLGLSLKWDY